MTEDASLGIEEQRSPGVGWHRCAYMSSLFLKG
jgi:hypothetical protein